MAFTVQTDDGGMANANAYIDVAFFKAYHDDRGNDYSAFADPVIQQAIVKGTDYMDSRFRYPGERRQGRRQTTGYPRLSAYDADNNYIDGIPLEVKQACAEYSFRALTIVLNPDPERSVTGGTVKSKSEKVGPISESIEYVDGGGFTLPAYPAVDGRLKAAGLIVTGGRLRRA